MKRTILLAILILATVVAQNSKAAAAHVAALGNVAVDQPNADQTQHFTPVEGSDLKARIDAALRLARSRPEQTPFWIAYTFDVRPGIGVDPNISEFNGNMTNFGGITLFFGTSVGASIETRNLGVFLLIDPSSGAVSRAEVYNLERVREYSGYQVYWLARAANQESLAYLKSLVDSSNVKRVAENAAVAIGLHDDPRVNAILKDEARRSANEGVRETAVFWLGLIGGEQEFLAGLVRNEQESVNVREAAVSAIGRTKDAATLALLQSLYAAVSRREVKERLISAISRNDDHAAAAAFLAKTAKSDPDHDLRQTAVRRLGQIPGTQALLTDFVRDEQEHTEIRQAAASALGRSEDPAALKSLEGLYTSIQRREVREQLISSISKHKDQQSAIDFLIKIAESDPDREFREVAISRLARIAEARCTETLGRIATDSKNDVEVQEAAIAAISKRPSNESVPLLVQIAKSHPRAEIRKEAIRRLSRTGDPRAIEFLKQLLAN